MPAATKWGILSAGKICQDFVAAMKLHPEEHQAVAVGARSLQSAQQFATDYGIPKAYGSYQEVCNDVEVDIIYVGTVHVYHYDLTMMALNAGKHVLCEKPLGMNKSQVQQMVSLAQEKKLFLMEAFWSRFFPVYDVIREEIASGNIGEPKVVTAAFGINASDVPRMRKLELGGGSLLDVGCYPVQFACMVFKVKPEKIVASGSLFPEGSDMNSSITLHYSDGRFAQLMSHGDCQLDNCAAIFGSKGIISLPDHHMWSPLTVTTPSGTKNFPLPASVHKINFPHSEGMMYEQAAVRQCLLKGETQNPLMTHADSLLIVEIMDEARKQMGVVYEADKKNV